MMARSVRSGYQTTFLGDRQQMHSLDFRRAVLMVYDYMGSMRRAAAALKVSTASISRWSRDHDKLVGVWPRRGSRVSEAMVAMIKLRLREHPSTSASQLRQHLSDSFGVKVSRQLISLVLRTRLGYSWKRIRKRGPKGSSWSEDQLDAFKTKFIEAFNAGKLSSWDESSFDQRAHAVYGYAPLGERAILNVPRNKAKHCHYSLVMGMHMNGTKHSVVLEGSVKGSHFANFVTSSDFPAGTVMLLDNHSMHKTNEVRLAASLKGYELLYTPPYSPEFNPIELAFGITKNAFYKLRYTEDFGDDMYSCITKCLNIVSNRAVSGCFRHVKDIISLGTGNRT